MNATVNFKENTNVYFVNIKTTILFKHTSCEYAHTSFNPQIDLCKTTFYWFYSTSNLYPPAITYDLLYKYINSCTFSNKCAFFLVLYVFLLVHYKPYFCFVYLFLNYVVYSTLCKLYSLQCIIQTHRLRNNFAFPII